MKTKLSFISFYILLPILLFVYGVFSLFGYLRSTEFGILTLDNRGLRTQIDAKNKGELFKGDIVKGEFHSRYKNLGVITVRFYNQDRDSKDVIAFRLKQAGQDKWLFESKYNTDQFLPHRLFPVGIPTINESDNQDYDFEIESLSGATNSGIIVDYSQEPIFVARSVFTKNELLSDRNKLFYFLTNKFLNIFGDPDIRLNTFFYFLPFIFYWLFLATRGVRYQFLIGLSFLITMWDIFLLKSSSDALYIALLFFWALIARRFHFESRIAGLFAIGYLIITPVFLILGQDQMADKSAVWSYLFLCITVAQQVYELRYHPKNLFELKDFYDQLPKISIDEKSPVYKLKRVIKPLLYTLTTGLLILFVRENIHVFGIYRTFYPGTSILVFAKNLVLPIAISSVTVFLLNKLTSKLKLLPNRLALLTLVFYLIFSFFINKTLGFTGDIKIFNISPDVTSEAWVDVTVTGKNFKDLPFVGELKIGDTPQQIMSWSDQKIIFRTNPQITKSGQVEVITTDGKKSNTRSFTYNFK